MENWVGLGTAVRVCRPCPKLYRSGISVKNIEMSAARVRYWDLSLDTEMC